MKQLQKGQRIALHVLDEHILPLDPKPLPLGGTEEEWIAYWEKCREIVGPEYDDDEICFSGYFITMVEELVGDQVLFRDSYGELRLVPCDQVITEQEAPKAFEAWLFQGEES